MNKHIAISIIVFFCVIIATIIVILIGKGYRFGFGPGKIELTGTGLLVAKSVPDGASVYINDHLTTATNNTINLAPNTYNVKITKEGYSDWQKSINVQKEVVSRAEATLFPNAPKLESITDLGANGPVMDPISGKIAYTVASQSAKKNGIYVLDTSARPILTLQSDSTQIIDDTIATFSRANLIWSPDGKQILATIINPNGQKGNTYLLDAGGFNTNPQDVTEILPTVSASWTKIATQNESSRRSGLPNQLKTTIAKHFGILAWSPDETKILYKATDSAALPIIINPRLIGVDDTPEKREIKTGNTYVYDIKEDRNYELENSDFSSSYAWFADSRHLIYVKDNKVQIMEYDGGNNTVLFAGPFKTDFLFPWSDSTRIVILTDLGNSNTPANLYTVSLK